MFMRVKHEYKEVGSTKSEAISFSLVYQKMGFQNLLVDLENVALVVVL